MAETPRLTRRRFLTVAAAVVTARPGWATTAEVWRGQALGAQVTLYLAHPRAPELAGRVWAELARLEDVFSLHRPGSALSRLNSDGRLVAPPFELVECLGLAGAVHAASGGAFDPTVQPLWSLYARSHAAGQVPRAVEIARALALSGWRDVVIDPGEIRLRRKGMALTLNGIAQGYCADRIATLLAAEGMTDCLIDTGEFRALGGQPAGAAWPVTPEAPDGARLPQLDLRDRALAVSAPAGTTFDADGLVGHILDPVSGLPAAAHWRMTAVTAPSAAIADGLSTAACLLPPDRARAVVAGFSGAALAGIAA